VGTPKRRRRGGSTWFEVQQQVRDTLGRPHRLTGTGATENEAVRDLAAKVAAVDTRPKAAAGTTLAEYADHFAEARQDLAPNTRQREQRILRNHVLPYVGHLKLRDIDPQRVHAFAETVARASGQDAAMRAKSTMGRVLGLAVTEGLLQTNAVRMVRRPRRRVAGQDADATAKAWTRDELNALLQAAKERDGVVRAKLFALYRLAVSTGARLGELLGLHWEDVDLRRGVWRLRTQLSESASMVDPRAPLKTHASSRDVQLPPSCVEALKTHAAKKNRHGLVFANLEGKPYWRRNFDRDSFKPVRDAAGVRPFTFHSFRHSWATHALEAGTLSPVTIAQAGGWKDTTTLLQTYAHALRADGKVRDAMADLFG
jgi:integrase